MILENFDFKKRKIVDGIDIGYTHSKLRLDDTIAYESERYLGKRWRNPAEVGSR